MGGVSSRERRWRWREEEERETVYFAGISCGCFDGAGKKGGKRSEPPVELGPVVRSNAESKKVPEKALMFRRAGLEKAADVLDKLGSSIPKFNTTTAFFPRLASRGNRISILAFEVANTITRGANLMESLSVEKIQFLKNEILLSKEVQQLVSTDTTELLSMAAADKREELNVFSAEVVRFGKLCNDLECHNLNRCFEKLDYEPSPREYLREEAETTIQQLLSLAQHTSELYHELHALDRFEQDVRQQFHEAESLPVSWRGETLMTLQTELKCQRKVVRSLKRKSLWSKSFEEVVEKLVEVVVFLHKDILDAFGVTGRDLVDSKSVNHPQRLGVSGLALHYANIISQINDLVSRPISLPPNTRDALYNGLPIGVKASLRSRLQSFQLKGELNVPQIKAEMHKILHQIVPMAENTIKAHKGFGWIGEWANMSTNNSEPARQHMTRIQTLHYADKEKTEEFILQLVIWLHHLVKQMRNRGLVYMPSQPIRHQFQKGAYFSPVTKKKAPAQVYNDKTTTDTTPILKLSVEDRKMLERVNDKLSV